MRRLAHQSCGFGRQRGRAPAHLAGMTGEKRVGRLGGASESRLNRRDRLATLNCRTERTSMRRDDQTVRLSHERAAYCRRLCADCVQEKRVVEALMQSARKRILSSYNAIHGLGGNPGYTLAPFSWFEPGDGLQPRGPVRADDAEGGLRAARAGAATAGLGG